MSSHSETSFFNLSTTNILGLIICYRGLPRVLRCVAASWPLPSRCHWYHMPAITIKMSPDIDICLFGGQNHPRVKNHCSKRMFAKM